MRPLPALTLSAIAACSSGCEGKNYDVDPLEGLAIEDVCLDVGVYKETVGRDGHNNAGEMGEVIKTYASALSDSSDISLCQKDDERVSVPVMISTRIEDDSISDSQDVDSNSTFHVHIGHRGACTQNFGDNPWFDMTQTEYLEGAYTALDDSFRCLASTLDKRESSK